MVSTASAYSSFSVNDIDAARRFYGDTLGIHCKQLEEGLALTLDSGARIFIYPKKNHTPATFTVLHLPVEDIRSTVSELSARGVTFLRYDGFDQDEHGIAWGFEDGPDIAWFEDPAGNVIGIAQNMDLDLSR